jgi:hypothetical protein
MEWAPFERLDFGFLTTTRAANAVGPALANEKLLAGFIVREHPVKGFYHLRVAKLAHLRRVSIAG